MSPTPETMMALVDCQSFYASCERVFHPELETAPLVVLSNNDGNVVALTAEAKAHQITTGTPWHQIAHYAQAHGIIHRSSNYELYESISRRVMRIIRRHASTQEIYSIDECFIELPGTVEDATALGHTIRHEVLKETGIPVRVGIGPSKTLTKLANRQAKIDSTLRGVCHLGSYAPEQLNHLLAHTEIRQLWGVGSRLNSKLASAQIHTAQDLRDAHLSYIRKKFGVVVARTALELRGIPCLNIDTHPPKQKDQLVFSRSFSRKVSSRTEMAEAATIYSQRAGERLRRHGLTAGLMKVWAETGWADTRSTPHFPTVTVPFNPATSHPATLAKAALQLIPQLFPAAHPEVRYARLGIMLLDLKPAEAHHTLPLFAANEPSLGPLLDAINEKHGRGSIGMGIDGFSTAPGWDTARNTLSQRATTHWNELATVHS